MLQRMVWIRPDFGHPSPTALPVNDGLLLVLSTQTGEPGALIRDHGLLSILEHDRVAEASRIPPSWAEKRRHRFTPER
ncbi:hypothetical protein [Sphingomonas abietis]|uniref:Uncharacterized protein n=1 Tax=Sphingomonas abietis TaxID=3012344 RepID=A0ABY7NSE0_9SPHN|nr:hypothetical protein [Sphingomonas abietis]WBO24462.1 hypothetical protein PBT88_10340 [Sphingomonas abietis]